MPAPPAPTPESWTEVLPKCLGTLQSGTQCTRKPKYFKNGGDISRLDRCWQHRKQTDDFGQNADIVSKSKLKQSASLSARTRSKNVSVLPEPEASSSRRISERARPTKVKFALDDEDDDEDMPDAPPPRRMSTRQTRQAAIGRPAEEEILDAPAPKRSVPCPARQTATAQENRDKNAHDIDLTAPLNNALATGQLFLHLPTDNRDALLGADLVHTIGEKTKNSLAFLLGELSKKAGPLTAASIIALNELVTLANMGVHQLCEKYVQLHQGTKAFVEYKSADMDLSKHLAYLKKEVGDFQKRIVEQMEGSLHSYIQAYVSSQMTDQDHKIDELAKALEEKDATMDAMAKKMEDMEAARLRDSKDLKHILQVLEQHQASETKYAAVPATPQTKTSSSSAVFAPVDAQGQYNDTMTTATAFEDSATTDRFYRREPPPTDRATPGPMLLAAGLANAKPLHSESASHNNAGGKKDNSNSMDWLSTPPLTPKKLHSQWHAQPMTPHGSKFSLLTPPPTPKPASSLNLHHVQDFGTASTPTPKQPPKKTSSMKKHIAVDGSDSDSDSLFVRETPRPRAQQPTNAPAPTPASPPTKQNGFIKTRIGKSFLLHGYPDSDSEDEIAIPGTPSKKTSPSPLPKKPILSGPIAPIPPFKRTASNSGTANTKGKHDSKANHAPQAAATPPTQVSAPIGDMARRVHLGPSSLRQKSQTDAAAPPPRPMPLKLDFSRSLLDDEFVYSGSEADEEPSWTLADLPVEK